jgi:site-specific DNA-methyltransferase (adenine-specific)
MGSNGAADAGAGTGSDGDGEAAPAAGALSVSRARATDTAPMVVWTNLLGREPITTTARELGWGNFRGEFVWGKRTREGNSGEEILRVVETALVFTRIAPGKISDADPSIPWAVVAGYDDDGEGVRWGSHPNHKPFSVLEPLIRTWSRPGELVMDPFAGSGSIPVAAIRLGRRAACIEREREWATRASERLAQIASGASGELGQ